MALRTSNATWIDLIYRPSQYTNTNNLTIVNPQAKPYGTTTTTISGNVVFKLKDSDNNKFCFKCILNNFEIKYKNNRIYTIKRKIGRYHDVIRSK